MNRIYDHYKDRVAFLLVYIQEAHPVDGMFTFPGKDNLEDGMKMGGGMGITQARTYDERHQVAKTCQAGLELRIPFVVDSIDNMADRLYAGWPERIYIIDRDGKIHYKGQKGPKNFKPDEAEASLKLLLQQ